VHRFEPESFQCAEVVSIAEFAPYFLKNIPVTVAGISPVGLGQMVSQIGLDAIIIEQSVVDIKKKNEVVH
jgi:hypothetical protein